jgi:hypothetical protein
MTAKFSVVPTHDIDEFWHQHILDTRKYAEGCQNALGQFLHHFPYFGMRGDEDRNNLDKSFRQTRELHAQLFVGEIYGQGDDATDCRDCGSSACGGISSGGKCDPGIYSAVRDETRPTV